MKVCVFTGSRAEFHLLSPLINKLSSDKDFKLKIYASGMHCSKMHGWTLSEIQEKYENIFFDEVLIASDSPDAITKSSALTMLGFSTFIKANKFDLLILLGDRFEVFAASTVALYHNLPIAHICGGESTEGLIDEAIRHSITKMSHLHFVTNKLYAENVIQMGENPENVFNFGSLGVENLYQMKFKTPKQCSEKLNFDVKESYLVTYHPITLQKITPKITECIEYVISKEQESNFIITLPNADTNSSQIKSMMEKLKAKYPNKVYLGDSLGIDYYFSCAKYCKGAFGNSSSGIIELPYLTNVINMGDRQKGRLAPRNVIQCGESLNSFKTAFSKLKQSKFDNKSASIYGDGKTSQKIVNEIKKKKLKNLINKKFYKI